MSKDFFQEQREQSMIKTQIVSKYFSAWSSIILATQKKYAHHSQKMAYVDLFAGPGRYDNQSKSTPLLVLETIINNPDLANRVVTYFNDKDADSVESLKRMVEQLEGVSTLKYAPVFYNAEVGDEIVKIFRGKTIIPTFFFVDPWGYKGLSLELVSSIIKDWGCDCVFFFNYNRVNMGVNNDAVREHMASLFGNERLDIIRKECYKKTPVQRESIIVQSLCDALHDNGSRYVLPFRFKNNEGARTSHHLVFISKSFKGYDTMKEIMHKESSDKNDGIASFEYNPRDAFKQGSIFDLLSRPLDELQDMLVEEYAGRTISFNVLYEEHSVDRSYVRNNYKEVFKNLLKEGKITAVNIKTGKPPRKGTFSDDMNITFGGKI